MPRSNAAATTRCEERCGRQFTSSSSDTCPPHSPSPQPLPSRAGETAETERRHVGGDSTGMHRHVSARARQGMPAGVSERWGGGTTHPAFALIAALARPRAPVSPPVPGAGWISAMLLRTVTPPGPPVPGAGWICAVLLRTVTPPDPKGSAIGPTVRVPLQRRHRRHLPGVHAGLGSDTGPAKLLAVPSRRQDCHLADNPSPSALKRLLKGEGVAAE